MINHSRTLLANLTSGTLQDAVEDFIPSQFVPIDTIPGWLLRLREVLLGKNPDRTYMLYRVRDLLSAVYASGNGDFLTGYDSRITHSDGTDNLQYINTVVMSRYEGVGPEIPPNVTGTPLAADDAARVKYRYKLIVTRNTDSFRVTRTVPGPLASDAVDVSLGQSRPLQGTGLLISRGDDALDDEAWTVSVNLQPNKALGTLVNELEEMGDVSLAPLLVTASGEEPLKSFRELWLNGKDITRRLSGITLAVIWHMEQLRRKRDGNR